MGRGWKIAIGVVAALIALLLVNALLVDDETKSAAVTVPGGRLLDLPGGETQVVDGGPRDGRPIVLIHCFTCGIDWWDGVRPALERRHRVVAVDLLGHDGSEKPDDGYSIESQARLVAQALTRLKVRDAEVVGHSLGGPVSLALAERSPRLVDRLVLIDSIPDDSYGDVGLVGELPFEPVIGQLLWRVKPDFSIRDGLGVAFAPGFEVPDAFVDDVKRMTYSAYTGSHDAFDDYTGAEALPQRAVAIAKPLLAIMGAEEQIANDPRVALAAYREGDPGAQTKLIAGAGHSPNVEKPAETARLILEFAKSPQTAATDDR
ncbi:MAG TPA: alpha/beta fold hydrolase [Solirubrobacterales bacterium]|jgi:pimeloyl-ACP methyl ester carboxylesterase|nr:alpha/beta fold hydrolase [Solirubrobacterales bacterium]